ncbi:MAG: Efflux ABC transporter, permease protein, partial [uncultured Solirubrobacteraceae bacterium]
AVARRARGAARAQAVDADDRRADRLELLVHRRLRTRAQRAHLARARRGLRPVHRPRPDDHGDGPGRLREQLHEPVPGPQRPLPQRHPLRSAAFLGGARRPDARRRGARRADRRRGLRACGPGGRHRCRAAARAARGGRLRAGAVRRARRRRRDLRPDVRPCGLRQHARDPAADVPRRGLLLRRRAAGPVARRVACQSDLLPRAGGALRLPRPERRQPRARAHDHGAARGGRRRLERLAVQHGPPAEGL